MNSDSPSAEKPRILTILELIDWGKTYLTEKGFDEARLTIELLLAYALHRPRIELYTKFDQPLSPEELAAFKLLLQRRLRHEPLQYITGTAGFMGLTFEVNSAVLIPRQETEVLVERVVAYAMSINVPLRLLDVGCGSGCITVSCAKMLQNAEAVGIDVSEEALAVAARNAAANGVADCTQFVRADIHVVNIQEFGGPFHIIVSNPPYISEKEFALLDPELQQYEPRKALADGGDGLSFYRTLASRGSDLLTPGGVLFAEHAYDQSESVMDIFKSAGWKSVEPFKDYSGQWRGVEARP
jgi:release factor glutamine methyltransferase